MESNEQNKLTRNTNRLIDTENRLTPVEGSELGAWVKMVKGLSKYKQKKPTHRPDNTMVLPRREGAGGREER